MQYPRQMMKTSELVKECGYKRSYLMQLAHRAGQNYAMKLPGGRDIYWDTEKLARAQEKFLVR